MSAGGRPTPPANGVSRAPQRGEARLRAALARLRARQAKASSAALGPGPGAPAPESEWEHVAEARLARIEQQLTNQNRLLILTLISIAGDILYGLAR